MNPLELYNCLDTYLVLAALLFGVGIYGLVSRRTIIGMLISSELILSAVAMNFMAFNRFTAPDPAIAQIFTLFIMAIGAAETAIAVAVIIGVYRHYRSVDVEDIVDLHG